MKKNDVRMFSLQVGIVGVVLAMVFGFVVAGCGSTPQSSPQVTAQEQASAPIEEADAARTHYERGNACFANGEYNKAIEEYTIAIQLYAEKRKGGGVSEPLDDSLPRFAIIEDHINYSDAYKKRGDAYAAIGDMEKANADYDKVEELNHDLPRDTGF
jgi:tetratricopeptide (TPR) repeat protein